MAKVKKEVILAPVQEIDELLTTNEVAAMVKMTKRALELMRRDRRGPAYIKHGGSQSSKVRYHMSDVKRWLDSWERCEPEHQRVA